jgi:DNA-binding phage protein
MKRELNRILDQIFKSTDDSAAEMARNSGLCHETVLRLEHRYTKYPRFHTVLSLAQAYGFTLQLIKVSKMRKAA